MFSTFILSECCRTCKSNPSCCNINRRYCRIRVEGLINAIERYSPQKNTRFETYALIRIGGAILDRIRAQDFLPRSVRRK
ncbi:MAG: sigma factor [Candidatus Gastranaerophilaceae bacterium]